MRGYPIIIFLLTVLVFGVGASVRNALMEAAQAKHGDLLDQLPAPPPGWSKRDMDIASTEEMQRAVNELLNYDHAIFREYTNGARSFSLYVSHWRPRKFHPRLISIHTPDVCWVGNGWVMDKQEYAYTLPLENGQAWPAQYREFLASGTRTYVLYWHIMNAKLSGYASGPASANRSFLERLITDIKEGTGEQFFIRVSSNQPMETWRNDPFFISVMSTFSPVLAERNLE